MSLSLTLTMLRHVLFYVYGLKMSGAAESIGRLIAWQE